MSSNNNKSSSYAACLSDHEKHDDDDDDNDGNINSDVLPSSRDIDSKEVDHLVSSSDGKVSSSRLSSNGNTVAMIKYLFRPTTIDNHHHHHSRRLLYN